MIKIFVIEDNDNIREASASYLKLEGFEVFEFNSLKPVWKALKNVKPDLILLDVMLPDGDGFVFAQNLKEKDDIPIIFFTARVQESARITGFEIGADDYIIKPFSNKEMVLRVKAVLKRTKNMKDSFVFNFNEYNLEILEKEHRVLENNINIVLTAAEWNILLFLVKNKNNVFSRLQILEHCLGSIAEGSERTVDTHINNMRNKFKNKKWLETVRGFGYRFNDK